MTELVVCLSSGEGTWGHIKRVIEGETWEKIFLITNSYGKNNFKTEKNVSFLIVDSNKLLPELIDEIKLSVKDKIAGTEVALNLISGTGKEHMAILSALLKLGLGVRLVALTKEGIREV